MNNVLSPKITTSLGIMALCACANVSEAADPHDTARSPCPPASTDAVEKPAMNPVYQRVLDAEYARKTLTTERTVSRYIHPGMSDEVRQIIQRLEKARREVEADMQKLLRSPMFRQESYTSD
jgi:hypothetical protein